MNTVKTGIDGLNLTFDTDISFENLMFMFEGISTYQWILEDSKLKWYRNCYSLKTSNNTTLVQFHVLPTSQYGERNLLIVNGLCFSDSALNALRPFNVAKFVYWALQFKAKVTKFDVYLDDFTASISQERLNEMSQPHTFKQFIQSPFLKCKDGERPDPRYYKGTWYYGQPRRNACEITTYNKGLSTRQRIHSKANPLKYTWQRYELRFASTTAKRLGTPFLSALAAGQNLNTLITDLFRKYLRFTEPNPKCSRVSTWHLQEWYSNLLALADQQPAATYAYDYTGEKSLNPYSIFYNHID